MHPIVISYLAIASFLFIIFVLLAWSFLGLFLTEIGLWFVWLPLGMLLSALVLFMRWEVLAGDRLNFVFLMVSMLLNFFTIIRVSIPFFEIKRTNSYFEQAMKNALGADYLSLIDPMIDIKYSKKVRFRFLHYLIGIRPRKLLEKVARIKDLTFYREENLELKLNVYYPKREGFFPTIVFIHGGAFILGSKDRPRHERLCMMLASYGFTVFNLDYRLTPLEFLSKKKSMKDEMFISAMVSDIHQGIIFAKKHATEYKGDPDEMFLFGRSAGGHLALLTVFSSSGKIVELDEETGQLHEYSLSGVIAFYPPTNFTSLYNYYGKQNLMKFFLERGIGGTPDELDYLYQFFSPINYLSTENSRSIPPVFLAAGAKDRLVAPQQSEELFEQLQRLGVTSVLLTLPWANHGFDAILNGPGGQLVIQYLSQFLVWVLTREKLKRLDVLAKKHGLEGLSQKEKVAILNHIDLLKSRCHKYEQYNKFLIDCLQDRQEEEQ